MEWRYPVVLERLEIHQGLRIICFADYYDQTCRRRQQVMNRLACYPQIQQVLYIELPLTLVSLIKYGLRCADWDATNRWQRVLTHGFHYSPSEKLEILTPLCVVPRVSVPLLDQVNLSVWRLLTAKLVRQALGTSRDRNNLVLWISSPEGAEFLGAFGEALVIYDCTEDFSAFYALSRGLKKAYQRADLRLSEAADLLFVQTKSMLARKLEWRERTHLIPNAVDTRLFDPTRTNSRPMDWPSAVDKSSAVLGYCGAIFPRLDLELLQYVAMKRPKWSLVLVGPVSPRTTTFKNLSSLDNIYLLGPKALRAIPSYVANFDVCLIPNRVDSLSDTQSPLKLFEYLAMNKPIVSTDIGGVRGFEDVVHIARDKEDFLQKVEVALGDRSENSVKVRLRVAQEHSWDLTVQKMFHLIMQALERKRSCAGWGTHG